ncbi:hypothetical protein SRHO_G00027540 [Serrasalmus rhombeus]
MLSCSTILNTESAEEGSSQQNSAAPQVQQQLPNTAPSAEARVTLRRSTFIVFITTSTVIILILFGGVVITTTKLAEMKDLLHPGQTEAEKEFPSLSRREGVVPDEVWRWIVAAKADVVLNPKSAHALLRVSNDGKSLYQSSPSSPPRVLMAETYLKCICVSSKVLPSTRVYLELRARPLGGALSVCVGKEGGFAVCGRQCDGLKWRITL